MAAQNKIPIGIGPVAANPLEQASFEEYRAALEEAKQAIERSAGFTTGGSYGIGSYSIVPFRLYPWQRETMEKASGAALEKQREEQSRQKQREFQKFMAYMNSQIADQIAMSPLPPFVIPGPATTKPIAAPGPAREIEVVEIAGARSIELE